MQAQTAADDSDGDLPMGECSLFLFLSLYTHTHIHARTHTISHKNTHAQTHTFCLSLIYTHIRTCKHTCAHTCTHTTSKFQKFQSLLLLCTPKFNDYTIAKLKKRRRDICEHTHYRQTHQCKTRCTNDANIAVATCGVMTYSYMICLSCSCLRVFHDSCICVWEPRAYAYAKTHSYV